MKTYKIEKQPNGKYRILKLCWVWYRWLWRQYGDVCGTFGRNTNEYTSRNAAECELVKYNTNGYYEIVD